MEASIYRRLQLGLLAVVATSLILAACGSGGTGGEVREGVDPQFESQVWISGAGMNQTDPNVWESRFAELCAAQRNKYYAIAERWVTEDADLSTREDGELPTPENAEEFVELIAGSVCIAETGDEVREGVDVASESQVWTSGTGLDQTDTAVWESRFDELCPAERDEYTDIAERWISEDAELNTRDDGQLPTNNAAERLMEVMSESVCVD